MTVVNFRQHALKPVAMYPRPPGFTYCQLFVTFSRPLSFYNVAASIAKVRRQRKENDRLITSNNVYRELFSLSHRACCRVTPSLHQPLHIYKIYNILHIKTLKTLRNISVLRPSSGSYIFLLKVKVCDHF